MQISGKEDNGATDTAAADPLRFGPKPDQLIPKLPQDTEAAEGGVYRPPRLNPVSMDDDPDKDHGKKERRRQQHAARKAGRSEFVQALASELEGAPEEVSTVMKLQPCLLCFALPCFALLGLALPCLALPCLALPCLALTC